MAFAVRLRPGNMSGLRRLLVGPWLRSPLSSTSAVSSQTSKSPSESDSKIYEMRTYYVKPKGFDQFMELTHQHIHLKSDNNSKLNGYWTSDIGGLNEVTHIWEYDSYAQRAESRKALSQDKTWINDYIKKIRRLMVKQVPVTCSVLKVTDSEVVQILSFLSDHDNLVMTAAPWYDVKPSLSTGGVYELRTYDIVLGKKEQWEHRLIQGLSDRCKLSEPVGVWFTEFGPVNTAIMLWCYESLDDRVRIRKEAQNIEEWVEAVRDCLPFETRAFSKVLIPTSFSPWR